MDNDSETEITWDTQAALLEWLSSLNLCET